MNRIAFLLLHAANLLVAASGIVYAWMLYLLEPVDEFSLWNHPWQGDTRDLHILAAPLLVLLVGGALSIHAMPRLRSKERAGLRSGLILLIGFLPMVLSGSLLQTAVDPTWLQIWLVVHLTFSAIWCLATGTHVVLAFRSRSKR